MDIFLIMQVTNLKSYIYIKNTGVEGIVSQIYNIGTGLFSEKIYGTFFFKIIERIAHLFR